MYSKVRFRAKFEDDLHIYDEHKSTIKKGEVCFFFMISFKASIIMRHFQKQLQRCSNKIKTV